MTTIPKDTYLTLTKSFKGHHYVPTHTSTATALYAEHCGCFMIIKQITPNRVSVEGILYDLLATNTEVQLKGIGKIFIRTFSKYGFVPVRVENRVFYTLESDY